jgi:phage shock protein A
MGIMTRVVKIFKADIHGVMDQLEDQGLLLKQHLRDMEEALSSGEARLQTKIAARKQAQLEHDNFRQQTEALEHDLEVAVKKNKDDIARMLIKKVKPLDDLRKDIAQHIRTLDEEIAALQDQLDQQHLKYAQIKHRALEYCHHSRSRARRKDLSDVPVGTSSELSEEEIELELLKRKEAMAYTEPVPPAFNEQPTIDH